MIKIIMISKRNCMNINSLNERLIHVEWNDKSDSTYLSDLVLLVNNSNFLMDLITESTKQKIQILEIKNKEIETGIICNLIIKVKNKEELEHFKNQITKFKDIKIME